MAKKHHMTKHEYVANTKKRHYSSSLRIEEKEGGFPKSTYATQRKKSETEMKNRLRNIRRASDDTSGLDEEYDTADE